MQSIILDNSSQSLGNNLTDSFVEKLELLILEMELSINLGEEMSNEEKEIIVERINNMFQDFED